MFASYLQDLMRERKLRKSQVAAFAGVRHSTVINWLRGTIPTAESLEKLAEGLGLEYDDLLRIAGDRSRPARQVADEPRVVYNADPAAAVQELTRLALAGLVVRIPIQDTPVHAGDGAVEAQYALLPTEYAGEHMLAFRVQGKCMEPVIRQGDTVIADASLAPEDGGTVVAVIDGEAVAKIFNARAGVLTALDGSEPVPVDRAEAMAPLVVILKRPGKVRR